MEINRQEIEEIKPIEKLQRILQIFDVEILLFVLESLMCKGGCEIGVMICILVTDLVNLRVRASESERERAKRPSLFYLYGSFNFARGDFLISLGDVRPLPLPLRKTQRFWQRFRRLTGRCSGIGSGLVAQGIVVPTVRCHTTPIKIGAVMGAVLAICKSAPELFKIALFFRNSSNSSLRSINLKMLKHTD